MNTLLQNQRERGSALLIVLGFLSFMTISAVSFAIYMRIERQASSNYRHTLEARHMLNAGLYRAIDEVEADLRDDINAVVPQYKFPANWNGRVSVSAPQDDNNDARVLSLEALSFIPGILVNDVRRHAVGGSANGVSWQGPKWRKISTPLKGIGDDNSQSQGESPGNDVGRYAYVCVNVSDMLNVNYCKAAARNATNNLVGIAHLFVKDNTPPLPITQSALDQAGKFDTEYFDDSHPMAGDLHYETLQDFYACMHERRNESVSSVNNAMENTPFGSPYHVWLKKKSATPTPPHAGFNLATRQILIADGVVKAEPKKKEACNILATDPLNNMAAVLAVKNNDPGNLVLDPTFAKAWTSALNTLPTGANPSDTMVAGMIADYLDDNCVPNLLNSPSVERVPMISQIVIKNIFAPKVVIRKEKDLADPSKEISVYTLTLVGNDETSWQKEGPLLSIETVWPFKNSSTRPVAACTLKATCCYKIIKGLLTLNTLKMDADYRLQLESPKTSITAVTQPLGIPTSDDWCFQSTAPIFQLPKKTSPENEIALIDEKNTIRLPGYGANDEFSVVCVILVQVFQGNDLVDQVPCLVNLSDPTANLAIWKAGTCKLYTQSAKIKISEATDLKTYTYPIDSLECPDPRFNYKASNWVCRNLGVPLDKEEVDKKSNPSTTELLGKNGRDNDIYMFVSDQKVLRSPGELGFIVRPFNYSADCNAASLGKDLATFSSANDTEDKDAMFRTVRLYDHTTAYPRDNVYDYFMVQNTDGTVPGTRVNPLSDIPAVLQAAIQNTPFDYYWAAQKVQNGERFNDAEWDPAWSKIVLDWKNIFVAAVANAKLNASWAKQLSAVYGGNDFGWYSPKKPKSIFNSDQGKELYEIDRKMLFSFSLDSFSDRQQLFLYIIRAEKTGPTLGSSAEGGVRSMAGGRAVALVWRDPYPANYSSDQPDSVFKNNEHDHRILYFKQLDN